MKERSTISSSTNARPTFALGVALAVAILFLNALATTGGVYAQDGEGGAGTIPFPPIAPEVLGAQIAEVVPDSPAQEAGLEVGDVIVSVQGMPVDMETSLGDLISAYEPGDLVTLEVIRAGAIDLEDEDFDKEKMESEIEEVEVTLGANSEDEELAFLGVRYEPLFNIAIEDLSELLRPEFGRPLNPDDAPDFMLPDRMLPDSMMLGVIVLEVMPDSPAADTGLEPGDRIVAVDGEPVAEPQELIERVLAMAPGDKVMLSIETQDGDAYDAEVTLAENEEGNAQIGVAIGSVGLDGFGEGLGEDGAPDFRFFGPEGRDGQDREGDEEFFRRHGERDFSNPHDDHNRDYDERGDDFEQRPRRQSRFMRFLHWLHDFLFSSDYDHNGRWERFQENHF